jgi:hypothetical protein
VHQPQLITVVHPSHEPFAAQGSVPVPLQALEYHAQSPQAPVDGPPIPPVRHVPSLLHQPQLARVVQSPQPLESAHGSAGSVDVHASPVQVSPAQQSAVVAHTSEPTSQAQRPPTHDIQPQQSLLDVHVPLASTQQKDVSGLARHDSPAQHSPAAAQAVPTGPQAVVPRAHWLDALHSSPVRHRSPLVQHGWPSAPHAPAAQLPPAHVPLQRLPQVPQLRGSRAVSTHARSQQVSPASVQDVPPQQGWPPPPHASGAVLQVPPLHTSPSLHAVPVQHGCRGPPHAGAVSHVPPVQTRPDAHAVPPQHGCREPPHAAGVTHWARSQTRPARQASPEQHGWRSSPQSGARTQSPEVHTRSDAHATPEQHGCPSRPQASTPVQVPAEQVSPGPHAEPPQQGSRSCPQRSAASPVVPSRPSSRFVSRGTSMLVSSEGEHPAAGRSAAHAASRNAAWNGWNLVIFASLPERSRRSLRFSFDWEKDTGADRGRQGGEGQAGKDRLCVVRRAS